MSKVKCKYPVSIYAIYDPRTDKPFYIGRTTQSLESRLYAHQHDRIGKAKVAYLSEMKLASVAPEIRLLESVESGDPFEYESKWVKLCNGHLTDVCNGGRREGMPYSFTIPWNIKREQLLERFTNLLQEIEDLPVNQKGNVSRPGIAERAIEIAIEALEDKRNAA